VEQVQITSSHSLEAVFLEYILIFTRINQGAKGVGNVKKDKFVVRQAKRSIEEKNLVRFPLEI
jgi:hypothetical protein